MSEAMRAKFQPGILSMTATVSAWVDERPEPRTKALGDALFRHLQGDWGNIDAEDRAHNDFALTHGERLLSSYDCDGTTVWVITEADRSVTTVLFPSDY